MNRDSPKFLGERWCTLCDGGQYIYFEDIWRSLYISGLCTGSFAIYAYKCNKCEHHRLAKRKVEIQIYHDVFI